MFRNWHTATGFVLSLLTFWACKPDSPSSVPCTAVNQLTAEDQCYSASNGLVLTASGQSTTPGESQFIWSVYPQRDTVATSANIDQANERLLVGNERITVPDSILMNAPRFVVSVVNSCDHTQFHSIHYSFVRRQKAGSSCSIWALQKSK